MLQAELLNKDSIVVGDGAKYRVTVTAVGSSWSNFDVVATGTDELEAADVVVSNYGGVAWFPVRSDVDEVAGNVLRGKFGDLKNAAAGDSDVVFDVSFNVKPGTAAGSYSPTISVGGVEATLDPVDVKANVRFCHF